MNSQSKESGESDNILMNVPIKLAEDGKTVIRKTRVDVSGLLNKLFIENGRLYHHEVLLCKWFPRYLDLFSQANETLGMSRHDDALPAPWKCYIAIMAISCYECDYLLKTLEEQFLLCGGNIQWLVDGLKAVDPKLATLSDLNEHLAFRPWTLDASTVEAYLQHDTLALKWSVQELLHAAAILSHYHALCALVMGQGLKEEADFALSFEPSTTLPGPITLEKNLSY